MNVRGREQSHGCQLQRAVLMTDSQRTIVQAKSHECGQASSFSSVASWLGLYSHVTYYSPKGCEFAQNCNQLIYLGSKPFNLKYNNLQSLLATVVMDHKLEWAHDMKLIYLQCMIGFFFFFSFPPPSHNLVVRFTRNLSLPQMASPSLLACQTYVRMPQSTSYSLSLGHFFN